MRGPVGGGRSDRGVSSTVTHALALSITAILISGLLFTAGNVLEDQRENSAREQLLTVGNRIADDLSRAADLARDGGNVSFETRHPTSIAGKSYHVSLLSGNDCVRKLFDSEACLRLELQDGVSTVMVPVDNETSVTLERTSGGSFSIAAVADDTATGPRYPAAHKDLRVGIGDDIDTFSAGTAVNATNKKPIAGFTFTPGQPSNQTVIRFVNDTKDLDGVIASYEWDFDGDGVPERTGSTVEHNFARPGKYEVTLIVTDDDGETDSVSKIVSVGGLVYEGDASARNVSGTVEDGALHFNVTNTHGAPAEINNLFVDPVSPRPDRLDAGGVGQPNEIVVSGDNEVGGYDGAEDLYPKGRIFDISADNANLSAGDTANVELNGFRNASGGDVVNMYGHTVNVTMRYEVEGQYYTTTFTLDPSGGGGGNQPPVPRFSVDCTAAPTCSFTNSSVDPDGSVTSYHWGFGDGDTTSVGDPTHDYGVNGTRTVSLTVVDNLGTSSTLSKPITVGSARPVLLFAVNGGGPQVKLDGVTYERDTLDDPHRFLFGTDPLNDSTTPSTLIFNTTDDPIYRSVRYGDDPDKSCITFFGSTYCWTTEPADSFGYEIPIPNGEYDVTMKFAELDTTVSTGDRRTNVEIEGSDVLTEYDVYDEAGGQERSAVNETVTAQVDDGNLTIEFKPDSNDWSPSVNSIVVTQEWADAYQVSSGSVAMEAENYMRTVPGQSPYEDVHWTEVSNGSASGGTALRAGSGDWVNTGDTEDGERLDYYVDFDSTGTYNVWVRMRCPDSSTNSINVGLDGVPVSYGGDGLNGNATETCDNSTGWTWASHAAGSQATVDVGTTGPRTVNVWLRKDGTEIDKVVLAKDGTYHPTDDGPTGPPESGVAPP